MIVKDILEKKPNTIIATIAPNATLAEATAKMCEEHIGSLLVCDETENPVGIITERDVLNQVGTNLEGFATRLVSEAMTADLICGLADDNANYIMQVMRQNRIRHLPIVEDNKVIGLISLGDLAHSLLEQTRVENRKLHDYLELSGQL